MRKLCNRAFKSAVLARTLAGGGIVLLPLLSSCGAGTPALRDARASGEGLPAPPYSIVFVINGDGDYVYHDTSGNAYKADEKALDGAKRIAERNPGAEVFIFHQMPEDHFLFFFPLPDAEFFCYRRGRLVANESYRRDRSQPPFSPELELYRRFSADNRHPSASVFVYCGHEISETRGRADNASEPGRTCTVHELAGGLKSFTGDSARFDIAILSTCYGGTPFTIGALGASARYIVASPDNLHLSYFDLHLLERLDVSLRDGDVPAFARRFARRSFDRLTGEVETAVSVAAYDADSVRGYVRSVQALYDSTLTALSVEGDPSAGKAERCDCAEIPSYVLPSMHEGVEVFFRAAHFGRGRLKQVHSGWECWREKVPRDSLSTSSTR